MAYIVAGLLILLYFSQQ